jgi:hypothetical protein
MRADLVEWPTPSVFRVLLKEALPLEPDGTAQSDRRERETAAMDNYDGVPFHNLVAYGKWHADHAFGLSGQSDQCSHVIARYRHRLSHVHECFASRAGLESTNLANF